MMDNYTSHLTTETRNALHEVGCIFISLPANSTSKVQLLDVGINKPFKDYYKRQRNKWMVDNLLETKVTRDMCATWISNSWEEVKRSSILNTARKIGFFNIELNDGL
jgi:hypothetical protein